VILVAFAWISVISKFLTGEKSGELAEGPALYPRSQGQQYWLFFFFHFAVTITALTPGRLNEHLFGQKSRDHQNIPFQKVLNLILSVYTHICVRLIYDLLLLDIRLPPPCKYICPLWDFTQRRLVVSYRRFGITSRSHLQGSSSRVFLDYHSMPRKIPKSADLVFFVIFGFPVAVKH
jgi:hypothetical protein